MVLYQGDLLILSGYDMDGDESLVYALMEQLLQSLTVDGLSIMPQTHAEDA